MSKTTITIRIDEELKLKAELACDYFGTSLTAIIIKGLRREVDEYYKSRSLQADGNIRHCQGVIAEAALEFLRGVTEIRNGNGENLILRPEVEKLLWDWSEG
jgi:hypothetical protein